MNKQEILEYLSDKKRLTAPVQVAQENLYVAKDECQLAKSKSKKTIVFLGILAGFCVLSALMNRVGKVDNILGAVLFGGFAFLLYMRKQKKWVKPALDKVSECEKVLKIELNNPKYIEGAQEFPTKFYNYRDTYRLWRLVEEGRADSLKEAFTLLEQQDQYADQMSLQDEMKSLQKDISKSSKVTAVSSAITAFNSMRSRK